MDVGDDTTASNCCLDEGVELFIASNGQLQVSRSDSLDLQVLGGVASELEDLSSEVLKDSCRVHSSSCPDSLGLSHSSLHESVDSSDGELESSSHRSALSSSLMLATGLTTVLAAFAAFTSL